MQRTNPFYQRGPIHDARFFRDRSEDVAQARQLLGLGQSIAIVGPRRIGKSSLLLHLARLAGRHSRDRYVYFDCEAWASAAPEALHALLVEALAGAQERPIAGPAASAHGLPYREFRRAVQAAITPGQRLVFLLDEFESLCANAQLDAGFFSGLRALATTGQVAFVTASARSLGWLTFAEPSALSSPFFNIFTQIRLNPFSSDAATALVRELAAEAGTSIAESAVSFVLDLAGPHPFFVQMAAYYAYARLDAATGALSPAAQQEVRAEFVAQAAPHWRYAWHELAPADRKELALGGDMARATPALLRRLRELALVVDTGAGPALLSNEVRAFFARQPVDELWQLPPLAIDGAARRVWLDGRELDVRGLEYDLLLLLAARPGSVHAAGDIHAALWPHDAGGAGNDDRLKSVVKGLRRRLGAYDYLVQNERGVGYTLAVERLEAG